MSIDVAFFGFLASAAEARTSQAGKAWVRMRVGAGQGDDIQWVSVACFGKAAEAAAKLRKGDRCYIEGTIKMDAWKGNDGVERHGLSVACFKIAKTHQIGRNRQKGDKDGDDRGGKAQAAPAGAAPFDDDVPF
jgi:single-strand DNA-binding protein